MKDYLFKYTDCIKTQPERRNYYTYNNRDLSNEHGKHLNWSKVENKLIKNRKIGIFFKNMSKLIKLEKATKWRNALDLFL